MKTMRTAMILLAVCPLTAIRCPPERRRNLSPLVRAVLRPQRRQELRLHLVRTMHDDGGSRHRRFVRAEPVVPVVRPEQPQHHGSGWSGEEMIRFACRQSHARPSNRFRRPPLAGVDS